jgi:hypothetical protein
MTNMQNSLVYPQLPALPLFSCEATAILKKPSCYLPLLHESHRY